MFAIQRLTPAMDRAGFRSGHPDLDRFFPQYAGQNQFRHHIGTTYVALDGQGVIAGFATVTASEFVPHLLPGKSAKRLPKYPLPVLRLARLAVDTRFKGQGAGRELLRAVFAIAVEQAHTVGCVGVVVDAKADAVEFYARLGFVPLDVVAGELGDRPRTTSMFLELGQLDGS